jgi:site-specific DNA-methyltransferase (adenine-specific)
MDYEFILLFKKLGDAPKPSIEQKKQSEITKEEWGQYFSSHWNFNGVKQFEHIAMFPEELPKWLIKMFSFVGETVLDPFAGSGTTSLAAKHLGRNSVGYEINKGFQPIIKGKILESQATLFDEECHINFAVNYDKSYSFESLPFIFHDPHKMDKKIDVKKLQFGSKFDGNDVKRDDFYSVKNVLSPEKIELSNGLIIKLLGVKENPQLKQQAIDFLQDKFQKRKVFLRYDSNKYDSANNLLCYVYLDNKTFVNNHLIRTGFVDVDMDIDYSCKTKFLNSIPM